MCSGPIDATFVGRHAHGVVGAHFGSETVLVDANSARSHVLNTSASLVWMLLDGSSTLGDLCADIAGELSAPYDAVLADSIGIVAQMFDMGVVVDADSAPARAPAPVPEPSTAWFDDNFSLGSAGSLHLRAGEVDVSMRANDVEVAETLRRVFAPQVVADAAEDPTAQLSILTTPTRAGVARMHHVYRDRWTSRCTTMGSLVRTIRAHLDDVAEPGEGVVRINARVLARADRVVLAVNRPGDLPDVGGRVLGRRGWVVVDGPAPRLDPSSLEVVVPAHHARVDEAAWADLDASSSTDPGRGVLAPGRYPVQRVIVLDAPSTGASDAASPARRALVLLPFVPPLDAARSIEVLEVLAALGEQTQVLQSRGWQERDLAAALPA